MTTQDKEKKDALLEVRDLRVHFQVKVPWPKLKGTSVLTKIRQTFATNNATVKAVDGVSLTIQRREALGLVGESGCGKSTLGRALLQLINPKSGNVVFDNVDLSSLAPGKLRQMRRRIQMIFQDPYASLNPRMNVGDALEEPLQIFNLEKGRRKEFVADLLRKVGLPEDSREKYPHEFSGGQRQRIGIARALALKPDFIVCDEPVSALDVSIQAQIVNLLGRLQKTESLTYLFISHDLRVVEHLCDRVLVMYLGRVVEVGTCDHIYKAPKHPYTRALLESIPQLEKTPGDKEPAPLVGDVPSPLNPPTGCPFHPRCPIPDKPLACSQEVPKLRQFPGGTQAACHLAE